MSDWEPAELFSPEHTGARLPDNVRAGWVEFCAKVRDADRALYNSYFENRWAKHQWPQGQHSVSATWDGQHIVIHCAGPHPEKRFNEDILPRFHKIKPAPMRTVADGSGYNPYP